MPQTAGVLAELGFAVLSRDHTAGPAGVAGLAEVPVTVDWFGSTRGVAWSRPELAARLAASLAAPGPTGLMFHHAVTDDAERALVEQVLALLAAHPAVRPTTVAALAA